MQRTKVITLLIVIISLVTFDSAYGQTFNYNFQKSTGSFTFLGNKTILSQNSDWHTRNITIPIGFQFAFLDSTFDTLSIESNGFIVFGNNKRYAIAAFNEILPIQDSTGYIKSSISYQLDGTTGQRILKIEYKDCGFNVESTESFSYQIWMFESGGEVDLRIGSSSNDSTITPFIGLINMTRDTEISAFLIHGDPGNPQSQTLGEIDDLIYLNSLPSGGTIYSFIPQPN